MQYWFVFKNALHKDPGDLSQTVRAKNKVRIPVVMTKDECLRTIKNLDGLYSLMVRLIYGGGLRITECIRLRVQDIDFDRDRFLTVRWTGKREIRIGKHYWLQVWLMN